MPFTKTFSNRIKDLNTFGKLNINGLFTVCFISIVFSGLIFFPEDSFKSSKNAINIFLQVVLPSLFPMMILSRIIINSSFLNIFNKLLTPLMYPVFRVPGIGAIALILGIFGGYPLGAQITSTLKSEKKINGDQAINLATITSFSAPLFIIGTVGIGLLGSAYVGYRIYICHVLSGLISGIIVNRLFHKNNLIEKSPTKYKTAHNSISTSFSPTPLIDLTIDAIKKSVFSLSIVGGLIIIFSVIYQISVSARLIDLIVYISKEYFHLPHYTLQVIPGIFAGLLEVTTGVFMISNLDILPVWKYTAISFLTSFSGLCIISQTIAVLKTQHISYKQYVLCKFLHSILSGLFAYFLFSY